MDVPEVQPTGQYVIYALIDPTDHRICYVGQTRNPRLRLLNHLSKKHHRGEKGAWLRSLEEKGHQPFMQILERVTDKETALAREQVWICRFLERGMPLINSEAKAQEQLDSSYLEQILFPTHQETAAICGCRVTRVWLPNGHTAIILRDLSTQLAIASSWQSQQIRSDPVLFNYLVYARIKTPGGPQIAAALLEGALPLWLASLRLTHISLEQREEIHALQRKAADVLCDYFSGHLHDRS
ncbi:MAG TPA: GIY-YIG nuclease family protein [Ktedonobacterales bacterium]|nr:GIY-YIG nuclease family protein [Ktedonobacterales bacterium]